MTRLTTLAVLAASACAALAVPAAAQSNADRQRFDTAQQRFDREYQIYRDEVQRFRSAANRGGPAYDDRYRNAPDYRGDGYSSYEDWRDEGGYDPARYYRSGNQYPERVLSANDRVYSGNDGRYYCKRSDGTTGLIVGGAAGGILGNVIDGGRSRTVGTLLGSAVGAVLGRSVEQRQSEIRCR